jgi:chitin synthase
VNLPAEERVAWTWCLLIAFLVPEVGTLVRSVRICIFKSYKRPPLNDFLFIFVMETLHVIGLASLVFVVLPNLDVVKGVMLTNCVCFVPALFSKYSLFDSWKGFWLQNSIT